MIGTVNMTASAYRIRRVSIVTAPRRNSRRWRLHPGCMALLTMLVVFVGLQLGIECQLDADAGRLRDPIYREKFGLLRSWPDFFQPRGIRQRVLFLGSSRTQLLVDAEALSNEQQLCFNFGCAGCGPISNALYFRRLVQSGLHFDTAIIEIHPAMLGDLNPPFEARWLHDHRLNIDEVHRLRDFGWALDTPAQFRTGAIFSIVQSYRMNLLNEYAPTLLASPFGLGMLKVTDSHGHVRGLQIDRAERWKYFTQAVAEYDLAFKQPSFGGPALASLNDTIQLAKQQGTAVLLLTPESSEYKRCYGPGGVERVHELARRLSTTHGVELIDAHDWIPDDEFADGHHVMPEGAVRMTARLKAIWPRSVK